MLEGFETLAYPTGLSLSESEPEELEPDELPPDDEPELDEPELDEPELELPEDEELEPEELEDEPKKPLLFPRLSTSHELESAENFPLVLTRLLRITLRFEYSADLFELESVPIELIFELNFEATVESIFQPIYC